MASKANFTGLRPKWLLLLILSLGYLVVVISACASPISTTRPASDQVKSPPPAVTTEERLKEAQVTYDTEDGELLFISKVCTSCHTIQGILGAQGKVGPELTHFASNSLIVGVFPNTEENLKQYLKDPSAVKPGALMPNQNLADSDIDALVAFLRTLK